MPFLLFPSRVQAENPKADSLRQVLKTEQEPYARCTTLVRLGDLVMGEDFNTALDDFRLALAIAEPASYQEEISKINNSLMMGYTSHGAYTLALEYGQKALSAAQACGKDNRIYNALINIANIYFYIGQMDMAKERYYGALKFLGKSDNYFLISVVYLNIGAVYQEQKMPDSALPNFQKSMKYVQMMETPSNYMLSALHNNFGTLNQEQGSFDLAMEHLEKALEFARKAGDLAQIATNTMNKGSLEVERGNLVMARTYLTQADSMVQAYEISTILPEICDEWANFYERTGELPKAIAELRRYIQVKDSLEGITQKEELAQIQTAYDSERQMARINLLELEHAKLHSDTQRRNLILWVTFTVLIATLVLALFLYWGFQRQRQSNRKLEELHREKDGLIGFVAHDLKAPLNKTRMLVEMLRSTPGTTDSQLQLLEMINKICIDGGLLIEDLLELSSLGEDRLPDIKKSVDLRAMMEEVVATNRAVAAKKSIQLDVMTPDAPVNIDTDPVMLGRVLENLISNAIKFSPSGRSVALTLHTTEGAVLIDVRDEGPGISEADQKKLYAKFQKLSARPTAGESSSGLGLSIVKALAQKLNATITCSSQLGVGTTFTVKLPR